MVLQLRYHRLSVAVLTALIAFLLIMPSAHADDAQLKTAVTQLLDVGWQPTSKSLLAAEELYVSSAKLAPDDVRVPYAMAVVAIKHHRYSRAQELIDEILQVRDKLWIAQEARLWLLVVQKQHEAALQQIDQMSKQLASSSEEPAQKLGTRAQFLGRIFGYIEGPGIQTIVDRVLQEHRQVIRDRLGPTMTKSFDAGRLELIESFGKRLVDQQQTQATDKVKDEKRRVRQADDLVIEKEQTLAEAAQLQAGGEKMQAALESFLSDIDSQLSSRRNRLNELNRQAAPIVARMRRLKIDLASTLAQRNASDKEDVARRARLQVIARQIDIALSREEAIYLPIAREGRQLEAEVGGLLNQRQAAVNKFQKEAKIINRKLKIADKRVKRVEVDQRKLTETEASGRSSRVRAKGTIAKAFTTYEPFPLERAKNQVLDSYR